jgi:anhydro-N-acetylmuramic acid kinase
VKHYIGVMSGTSMDGVDVALCRIDGKTCRLEASLEYPFEPGLKTELLEVIGGTTTVKQLGLLDHRLGALFAEAVNALLEREGLQPETVEAVGLHGQTLWHEPSGAEPFTMQLGDPNIVATRTKITTVADFRRRDMALGGQGAPFAPAFHAFLFGELKRHCAVVNIGGIANITLLGEEVTGYDTGPGNMLLDGWIFRQRKLPFDADGSWARAGTVVEALLEALLDDPYFRESAPKSTGRERFNTAWLESKLTHFGTLEPQDVQATLTELTARTIAEEAMTFKPELLLLCGGGAKNSCIRERLGTLLEDTEVACTDDYGVSGEDMEAMAFAWLAYKRLRREPVALKSVTGAKENGILGGIYA